MKPGKRKLFLLMGAVMLLLMGWLIYNALQPPTLPAGAPLPILTLDACVGTDTIRIVNARPVLVMLFSTGCTHCLYELDLLESHFNEIAGFDIFLITLEKNFRLCEDPLRWLNLASSENVKWNRADRKAFKAAFGVSVSPSLFMFDGQGKLKNKIRGEVKIEKILASWQ